MVPPPYKNTQAIGTEYDITYTGCIEVSSIIIILNIISLAKTRH